MVGRLGGWGRTGGGKEGGKEGRGRGLGVGDAVGDAGWFGLAGLGGGGLGGLDVGLGGWVVGLGGWFVLSVLCCENMERHREAKTHDNEEEGRGEMGTDLGASKTLWPSG